jgi:hypothetical protein
LDLSRCWSIKLYKAFPRSFKTDPILSSLLRATESICKQLSSKYKQEAIPGIFLPPLVTSFPGTAAQKKPSGKPERQLAVQLELLRFKGDKLSRDWWCLKTP